MENIILDIQNIKKTFASSYINLRGEKDTEIFYVLNDLNLQIKKGKITTLIGGNGSGKSTLFNIIGNFLPANQGNVFYNYEEKRINLLQTPSYKMSHLGIGRMFQGTHIFKNMTLLENILLGDNDKFSEIPFINLFFPKKEKAIRQQKITKAERIFTELLGEKNVLWKKRNELVGSFSYGQQRIIALIRLLMNDNLQLLLLDEPCVGVNSEVITSFIQILQKLKQMNKSICLIEHNLDFVKEVTDECHYLSEGKIHYSGTASDVLTLPIVQQQYIGNI